MFERQSRRLLLPAALVLVGIAVGFGAWVRASVAPPRSDPGRIVALETATECRGGSPRSQPPRSCSHVDSATRIAGTVPTTTTGRTSLRPSTASLLRGWRPGAVPRDLAHAAISDLFEREPLDALEPLRDEMAPESPAQSARPRLVVIVREEDGERCLSGAEVGLLRDEDRRYVVGKTGADGRVVFDGLAPGLYRLNARCDGHLRAGEELVSLAEAREIDLELEKAVPLIVKVLDEQGRPVEGARLWTGNVEGEYEVGQCRETGSTDRDGIFRFAFEPEGRRSVLFVGKEGFGMARADPEAAISKRLVLVKLLPGRAIHGVVRDASGAPVAAAVVSIDVTPEDDEADDLEIVLTTDDRGRYDFAFLPDGEVFLEVEADGHADASVELEVRGSLAGLERSFVLDRSKPGA